MAERIGDFLLRIGAMTRDQVDEVLKAQSEDDDEEPRMFGEIAIEKGYIHRRFRPGEVHRAEERRRMRKFPGLWRRE